MKQLPNNCRVGNMSVHPKNWKTTKASPNITWRIVYWFYDDNAGIKKQISKKGMNDLPSLKEKQAITQDLLTDEMKVLELGFNPITNKQIAPEEIDPNIPTERTSLSGPIFIKGNFNHRFCLLLFHHR